jgi:3-hydroxyacyl-[acyl-carrier-protein] dehydratase
MNPEIARDIPHRPPFLFIDDVVEWTADRMVTQYRADPAAEFFKGHYPGNPVMPGVLICECAFQAGALLLARRMGVEVAAGGTPVLTRINEAKFRHMVRPGDVLAVEVQLDEELGGAYFMTGRVTAGGNSVLRVTFACTLISGEAE